jgi:MFS family permease
MSASTTDTAPATSAFAHRSYLLYWLSRFLVSFAVQIATVAVGWQIYDVTREPFLLGLVGLVQFAPALALVLVTGSVADRYNRRRILAWCFAVEGCCVIALLVSTIWAAHIVWPIFIALGVMGTARAFSAPALQSLVVNLVPVEVLPSAIAWNSSSWQIATVVGPVAGGLLYGISAETAYGTAFALIAAATVLILLIPKPQQKTSGEKRSLDALLAGFRFVWGHPIVLGAISLDLFAVLLGGATALLPAYARDILDVGPWGLGLLRSAPGIGAVAMAIWLARRPITDKAGLIMFIAVAAFGLFTTVFGFSTIAWISIVALALAGAADMISVYIRETLIQLATPDEVRGRVSAVNMTFIGASNELGEFRAGVMAALIGVVPAVVVGGLGTMLVAGLWARGFPELRRARRLDGK